MSLCDNAEQFLLHCTMLTDKIVLTCNTSVQCIGASQLLD